MRCDLSERSLDLFDALWHGDLNTYLEQVDAGFSFVSPLTNAHEPAHEQLESYCKRVRSLPKILDYRVLQVRRIFETDEVCTILLLGNVLDFPRGTIGFRCTFVWHIQPEEPKLVHMHFSLPLAPPDMPIDKLPVSVQARGNPIVLRDTDGHSHVVNRAEVLYLESRHQYTIVHLPQRQIRVRIALSDLLRVFPDYFVRVHRSYVINVLHVEQISRREIRLAGGSRIPIPERRSKSVREEVLDAMVRARLVSEHGNIAPPRIENRPRLESGSRTKASPTRLVFHLSARARADACTDARCGRSSRPDRADAAGRRRWTPGPPASSSCPWRRPARSCGGSRPGEGRPAA